VLSLYLPAFLKILKKLVIAFPAGCDIVKVHTVSYDTSSEEHMFSCANSRSCVFCIL